ncbi:hypothetical protein RB195_025506 [Necator americanus]|uniref:Uncharacterized protein n=1 Tax=Necator americanus TaxID=51031 RepID=A0ABR1ESL7_NECAM
MRIILFVFLSLIAIALSLDCRKFSFAPACRGIMLKRSETTEQQQSLELYQLAQNLEMLSLLIREAEAEGIKECIPISWIRNKLATLYLPSRS